jgi:hypothetical protein
MSTMYFHNVVVETDNRGTPTKIIYVGKLGEDTYFDLEEEQLKYLEKNDGLCVVAQAIDQIIGSGEIELVLQKKRQ